MFPHLLYNISSAFYSWFSTLRAQLLLRDETHCKKREKKEISLTLTLMWLCFFINEFRCSSCVCSGLGDCQSGACWRKVSKGRKPLYSTNFIERLKINGRIAKGYKSALEWSDILNNQSKVHLHERGREVIPVCEIRAIVATFWHFAVKGYILFLDKENMSSLLSAPRRISVWKFMTVVF